MLEVNSHTSTSTGCLSLIIDLVCVRVYGVRYFFFKWTIFDTPGAFVLGFMSDILELLSVDLDINKTWVSVY